MEPKTLPETVTYDIVRAVRVSKQGVRILIEVLCDDGATWKGFDLSAPSALNLEQALHSLLRAMRGN